MPRRTEPEGLIGSQVDPLLGSRFCGARLFAFVYQALFAHGHTQLEAAIALVLCTIGGGLLGLILGSVVWLVNRWPHFEKRGRVPRKD